jgi:hypothetical protein
MSAPNVEKEPGPQNDSTIGETQQTEPVSPPEKKVREYKDFGHDEEKATRMFHSTPLVIMPLFLSFLRRPCRYVYGTVVAASRFFSRV